MRHAKILSLLALVLVAGLSTSGCTSLDQSRKYTLTGLAGGAAGGAALGAGFGDPITGALIGGLVGGGLGLLYEEFWTREVNQLVQPDQPSQAAQPSPAGVGS
jgi:uncharacterized membrane protein YebE (DUF533 family)